MKKIRAYLVIRADGTVRAGIRPRIGKDEVAYRLNIFIPPSWGAVAGDIDITLPEPPTAEVEE